MVIDFEVDAEGHVRKPKVTQDTIKDPEVGCCAAVTLSRMRFDPPARPPLRASYPFVFVDPNAGARPPKRPPEPTTYCAQLKRLVATP